MGGNVLILVVHIMPRAAQIEFNDDAIFAAPFAGAANEIIIKDPLINGHRLVIKRRTKSFELQLERPRAFGPRRTYVLVTGTAPYTKIDAARKKALEFATAIKEGKDPKVSSEWVTLREAWEIFKARPLKPRTLRGYESLWKRCLTTLADTPLATLSAQPRIAQKLHAELTKKSFVDANRAMQLLRAIYNEEASGNRSLNPANHPCTSIEYNPEEEAAEEKYIKPAEFPAWTKQLNALRKSNPWRASYQLLLVRLGIRPNELQAAKWEHIDEKAGVLMIPSSKTHPYQVPLCKQIIEEFRRLRKIIDVLHPGSPYVCPPSFATAKHPRYVEDKDVLSHSGSAGRTTHHSIGSALGFSDKIMDIIEGRALESNKLTAGGAYLARSAFWPDAKKAQRAINDRIDKLLKTSKKGKAK